MQLSAPNSAIEKDAIKKALESNFEVLNVDIEKMREEVPGLDWREELEDLWAYSKGFD